MKEITCVPARHRKKATYDTPGSTLTVYGPDEHGFPPSVVCVLSVTTSYGSGQYGDAIEAESEALLDLHGVVKLINELQSVLVEAGHEIPKKIIDESLLCRHTKPQQPNG